MSKDQVVQEALRLAEHIQTQSLQKEEDSSFKKRLKVLFTFPPSKTFLIKMMDVSFRPKNQTSVASFVKKILSESRSAYTNLFTWSEKILVDSFLKIGYRFPFLSVPIMLSKIRADAAKVVFLKDSKEFNVHIESRKQSDIKSNVNLIGESLLGEEEAAFRINQYKKLLHDPQIDYISIKISTIYSQINVLSFNETVSTLCGRLAELYDEILAIQEQTGVTKFINLDMEEYRDMSITVGVFTKTLSYEKFKTLKAGIVLQAYIPDSYQWLQNLQEWAKKRVQQGGAPIKIRVVKGANMEMEKTESALRGWPVVTFDKKLESDANYKKMLLQLLTPESCKSIKVGIASHNVFDIAFGIVVVKAQGLHNHVEFEMLEGMANGVVEVLKEQEMKVLLYTPVVKPDQYISAIAYLVRRLDEGTAPGNFLKEGFELSPNTPAWNTLKTEFITSVDLIESLPAKPRRTQDRLTETPALQLTGFTNEPDTDWILPANREWLQGIKLKWENNTNALPAVIPVVGVGESLREKFRLKCWQGELPWEYELASEEDYQLAIKKGNTSSWLELEATERINIIRKAAVEIQKRRGDLIGVAVTEVGKLVSEIDPEISEAVDFANYYAYCMEQMSKEDDMNISGGKVNLVLPPWNFPVAIPAGGIIASLVTGNVVILKPSQNAIACSYILCECLWRAGVPKDALFFLPAKEEILGPFLRKPETFGAVILTGGTDTAKFLLKQNTRLPLFAETGGKNATIVTALSDREQAIAHVLHSAFGNVGQKCSATSLLILEKEVFEDEEFKKSLTDAVRSLKVGSPWDFSSKVGPMTVLPSEKVERVMKDRSNWLIQPELNSWYLHPSIKWGIRKEDFECSTELFAPILSVMCAQDLKEAVSIANSTDYGLTSGLESLDDDEINYWKENIHAGNLYINRPTTGAIVQRQPFGGIKQSSFGFGMKAGGVNYLTQFVDIKRSKDYFKHNLELKNGDSYEYLSPEDKYELLYAKKNYASAYANLFQHPYEEVKIRGQYNVKRYLKPEKVILCIDNVASIKSILLVAEATKVLGVELQIYQINSSPTLTELKGLSFTINKIKEWKELESMLKYDFRFRILTKEIPDSFRLSAIEKGIYLYEKQVLPFGRYELLNYLTEQSISHNYHRYGNLMGKE